MATQLGTPLNFGTAPSITGGDYGFSQSYKNALAANTQLYAQALSGYQQVLGAQEARHQDLAKRYTALGQQVQGYLGAAESAESERLAKQYAQFGEQARMDAVNAGLGNWTVGTALQAGVQEQQAAASRQLAGQFADRRAGYASQLGLAGLGFEAQAGSERDAMSQAGLQFMSSWRQDTPDPLGYAQLAQQQKQWQADQPYQIAHTQTTVPAFNWGFGGPSPAAGTTTTYKMFDPRTGRTTPSRY